MVVMNTLEHYLTEPFTADSQDVSAIEDLANETCASLLASFTKERGWPYRLTRGGWSKPIQLSHSTTAMVALALLRLGGAPHSIESALKFPPISLGDKKKEKSLKEVTQQALEMLLTDLQIKGPVHSRSTTYGPDDPVTLSFLAELVQLRDLRGDARWQPVRVYVEERTNELSNCDLSDHKNFYKALPEGMDVIKNAIIPLRAIQANRATRGAGGDYFKFIAYFESQLHDQLSFSSIPDSRFDPAELTFCLEGLLLCQKDAVDPALFRRVVEVLTRAQQESAFWRPTKPFLANERGMALFPVSVEVANSLLRSCEFYDRGDVRDTVGSTAVGLFRRYWQWVRARAVRFREGDVSYVGWHSEHVNEPDAIHVWETSQILEFLINYRRILLAHIARTTLLCSRFTYDNPKTVAWDDIEKQYEPVTSLGKDYCVYKNIGNDFVKLWERSSPDFYSMLLYGPPGTGKTTIAENIAHSLSFRLVTITVSDFLGGGGAQIEARAKAIFEVLLTQPRCVVLFDEIDHFLLDRDSPMYGNQESLFQFMTPGMLTKLNNLRRAKRLIFIIATNYENRIDPAIKRTGRIDKRYLVLPYDWEARRRILEQLLRKIGGGLDPANITVDDWDELKRISLFLSFKDIEGAVKTFVKEGTGSVNVLKNTIGDRAKTTSLSMYQSKFGAGTTPPYEEFFCLLAMALNEGTEDDIRDISGPAEFLLRKFGPRLRAAVEQHTSLPDAQVDSIVKALGRTRTWPF